MSHLTEDFLRKRSQQILDAKAKSKAIFNTEAEASFPRFKPDEITLGRVLGKGGFCTVSEIVAVKPASVEDDMADMNLEENPYIGLQNKKFITERHLRNGKARYAIKKVTDGCFQKGDPQFFVSSTIDLAMEVKFLAVLRHTHIIKMRALADVPHTSGEFFILMDCLTGTLEDRIEKIWTPEAGKRMLRKEVKKELMCDRVAVAFDICSALEFLHEKKIIYRDLKPENLGFDVRDDIKLFDFGLSAELDDSAIVPGSRPTTYNLTGETGSFRYMAPEVANSKPYNTTADVFAVSILLSFMIELKQPFKGYNFTKMKQKVFNGKDRPAISKDCPKKIASLLPKMWDKNLANRPDLEQVKAILEEVILDLNGGDAALLDMTNRTNKSLNGR